MLATERQARIVAEVERKGSVRVTDLASMLAVSDMTIRRDLDVLARENRLAKVHGGATTRRTASTDEPGFAAKARRQQPEKAVIAARAASLVEPGAAIGLSAGTTTATLAGLLLDVDNLTVVTNSIRIADLFHNSGGGHTVVITGGVRTPSDALVGPLAVSALQQLHLDTVFLGVHGMDAGAGFTTPNMLEAETDRALVAAARKLVVVADHTKWQTVGISTITTLDRADVLITDNKLDPDAQECLQERVGQLILCDPDTPEH
ncbi:DeoR/GlpR family DNA-binding transcription regulator [Naumannella halotolerans]|uniref:DeoR/GlpR family transcriptional regulator of sugar metabolism n=1 Tax=Naumannella halotolerans TaxID=993414 RepID=A0A4R7J8M4_9ACTN|nr:DeoR/GlpR family DNA-binding transcription regulator [Naumannella halotolerans]TDT33851.1 DeoR/GlpR family transcriptional regulator of sugar metabolism [Naumannella halotolerans]